MQIDKRIELLLSNLSENTYISLGQLSEKLSLSERSIRSLLNQLDEVLKDQGAVIERSRGRGVRLNVENREQYQSFAKDRQLLEIPEDSEQRGIFIISRLFENSGYMKADELCAQMFISRKTFSQSLKQAETYLKKHHLVIERKPYYGIRIKGSEFSIRLCLSALLYEYNKRWFKQIISKFQSSDEIREAVLTSLKQCGYTVYEMDIPNMVLQIQIALYRAEKNSFIKDEEIEREELLKENDIRIAQTCGVCLEKMFHINLPIPEIKYLAIQFLGKKKTVISEKNGFFIDMEINQLVNRMLESVNQIFQLDFRTDFDLNTSLRQHMVSLRIRLQYGLRLDNPLLKEIKEEYTFPYAIAAQASTVLSEHFHTIVPDEEIGYIALCFALSIQRKNHEKKKRNILLVCASGQGSAKLFQYRFMKIFGEYLNKVEICDIGNLKQKDFGKIDYVFSTVPLKEALPVPVCQVQYFFDKHNTSEIKRILNDENEVQNYFDPALFFTGIKGETREEVIHEICEKIGKIKEIPDDFEACVLKRENLMQTDFCGQVAIPHPYKPITKDTFVCTAILDKPIKWCLHEIQIVFLLSISTQKENLEKFYSISSGFMMDERCISRLIREKTYDALSDIIYETEHIEK